MNASEVSLGSTRVGLLVVFGSDSKMGNTTWRRVEIFRIWKDSAGEDLIEYSMGVGMVAFAAVAAMPGLNAVVNNLFGRVGSLIISSI